jgi:AcrR family transcriptional regulator
MIQAAADLFHKQGIGTTSPDEIVRAAGGETRQFYQHFKNKEGIVHAVLLAYLEAIEIGTSIVKCEFHSWQDLTDWFLAQLQTFRVFRGTRSCPLGTMSDGVTENDTLIRNDLCLIYDLVANRLTAFFIQERAQCRFPEDVDANEMAYFCLAVATGSMLMGKITRSSQTVESTLHVAFARIDSVAKGRSSIASSNPSPTVDEPTEAGLKRLASEYLCVTHDLQSSRWPRTCSTSKAWALRALTRSSKFQERVRGNSITISRAKQEVLQQYLRAITSNVSYVNYHIETWQDLQRWFSGHIDLQKQFSMARGCPFGTIGNVTDSVTKSKVGH